jgi:peptidoglycan/xylan/chitin deacetylase (PgdA/CDA1 family)
MSTSILRRGVGAIPWSLALARWLRSRSVAIIAYHGVAPEPLQPFYWCQIDASEFQRQIAFISSEYKVLPLREVVERLGTGKPIPDRCTCLTFDDGFRNVATVAFPIMERYQVPSTVFLITGLVGGEQPAWPDRLYQAMAETRVDSIRFEGRRWHLATLSQRAATYCSVVNRLKCMDDARKEASLAELCRTLGYRPVPSGSPLALMNWEEVEQLSRSGLVDFGSHTHTHPILSRCPPDRVADELSASRKVLLDRLGNADLFAYPNGTRADFSAATKRTARDAGYRCALSTIAGLNGPGCDLFALRRVNVGADMSCRRFEMAMAGLG